MSGIDLWGKYCSFYEKPFLEQMEDSRERIKKYFEKWRQNDLAKMLCQGKVTSHKEVPVTRYGEYTMLKDFGQRVTEVTSRNPKKQGELLWQYYLRIGRELGAPLDRYMAEPFYFCAKTTGTTGAVKWFANGETFMRNHDQMVMANVLFCCSDSWGETKLVEGDTALNISAPVPYISGWGARVSTWHFKMVPPIEVTDNLQDMKKKFSLVLDAIGKGNKISVAGGTGSMFYMICRYFVDPEEFYESYYRSMSPGLKKALLSLKLLQCKLSKKEKKKITDYLPLKGVIVAGIDAQLYIDFFRKEFGLEPLQIYGSTEMGSGMRGDPDRKTDLVPDLSANYLEFRTGDGEIKDVDELKKGEIYDLIVTPPGSILFRYDTDDFFRVVDFRDDGMPILAFEGRKQMTLDVYGYYRVTPHIVVKALSKAGFKASDKWAVAKLLEPREHLCFLMEKEWSYSEEEAAKLIFDALKETNIAFKNYVTDFNIEKPSEAIKVEYLKKGAFTRYSAKKAQMGYPMGQYKPPQIILPDRMDVYEMLRSV